MARRTGKPNIPGGRNRARVLSLVSRVARPKFRIGELVRPPHDRNAIGAVDKIYADLRAAIVGQVSRNAWYAKLRVRPKTPKTGIWYSVVLTEGAILAGEDDLRRA